MNRSLWSKYLCTGLDTFYFTNSIEWLHTLWLAVACCIKMLMKNLYFVVGEKNVLVTRHAGT